MSSSRSSGALSASPPQAVVKGVGTRVSGPQPGEGTGSVVGADDDPDEHAATSRTSNSSERGIGRVTDQGPLRFPEAGSGEDGIICRMRRLLDAREHLDGALSDRAVLRGNLRDLRRVNAIFGGVDL